MSKDTETYVMLRNGESSEYKEEGTNDDDDDDVVSKANVTNHVRENIFCVPIASAISKQKGNRLKIRSRSPSPFTTPNKSASSSEANSSFSTPTNTSTSTTITGLVLKGKVVNYSHIL